MMRVKEALKSKEKNYREKPEESAYDHWLESGFPMEDGLNDWKDLEKKFPAPYLRASTPFHRRGAVAP
jgi:hypothetical protein